MSGHTVGFEEGEDVVGAEEFIQEDSGGEEEDALEETIADKYSAFRLNAARETRLRARSAPTIGSPSSATQRKRSAERLSASRMAVRSASPRQEYTPSERLERPASRLQQEGAAEDECGWTSDSRSPLATVDENNAAAFGSQQGSSEKGSPVRSQASGAVEQQPATAPAARDPYDSAMSYIDMDLAVSDAYFTSPSVSREGSARGVRRAGSDTGSVGRRAGTLASQGVLGMWTDSKRHHASRRGSDQGIKRPVIPPPPPGLLMAKTEGRKPLGKDTQGKVKQSKSAKRETAMREKEKFHRSMRETTLLSWNDAYADKVRRKLEIANSLSKELKLPSEYRLTTVGSDHAVAVQVTMQMEKKWHPTEQTISVQSFLNTYNRLCKLHAARQRASRAPERDDTRSFVPPSPGARNQAELVHALHETMMLCDTLSEQVALLRGTQPTAHRISDHLSFAGV